MATPAASDVQALFNSKAQSWQNKYGPGGRLNSRLEQFTSRLSLLCQPPANILDLGCGTGEFAAASARTGYRVTACDIAENMLEVARSHWAGVPVKWLTLRPGWTALPFEDFSFDGIVASSVFEYLPDVEGVVSELARALRPGGVLIFSVPNPCNRSRKIEEWFRCSLLSRVFTPSLCPVRAVRSFLTYLQLSRNRFAADRWKSILSTVGLEPVNKQEFSHDYWMERSDEPLILLAVKKVS